MCEQHSRSLLLCLWFLFVSRLSNFLSHPSVPGPRNLVNKQAPERSREPATSWKSEAMWLSTKTLSFQEGMTESEQWPWLPMNPRPTFPTLFLSALHPSCPKLCVGGGWDCPQPALLHKPTLPLACASGLSVSTKLGWVKFPLQLWEECPSGSSIILRMWNTVF